MYGSVATAVGSKSGRLQVRPSHVRATLYLSNITVGAIKRPEISLRTAQDIAKAGRHAAHGVHHYLQSQPQLLSVLSAEFQCEFGRQ